MLMGYNKTTKTYNSGDSLVVTYLTTNPPVLCLYVAERTGSLIFKLHRNYNAMKREDLGSKNILANSYLLQSKLENI